MAMRISSARPQAAPCVEGPGARARAGASQPRGWLRAVSLYENFVLPPQGALTQPAGGQNLGRAHPSARPFLLSRLTGRAFQPSDRPSEAL
jgi:hypothetical protein